MPSSLTLFEISLDSVSKYSFALSFNSFAVSASNPSILVISSIGEPSISLIEENPSNTKS